ncbi:hypothetical protein HYT26_04875 [Candidatus Pacearchaeota archaeon]|nr:hypothetical protein [Candidatus Pacearchaeota archaeon]
MEQTNLFYENDDDKIMASILVFHHILQKLVKARIGRLLFLTLIFPIAAVAILFMLVYREMIRAGGILRVVLLTMNISGALLLVFSAVLFKSGNIENGAGVLFLGTCLFCIPINAVGFARMCRNSEIKSQEEEAH